MRESFFLGILWLACLSILGWVGPASAESRQEVAASLAAGNRAALESIRTFHAKMRVESTWMGKVQIAEEEEWRRGKDVRQKQSRSREEVDAVRVGGRETSLAIHTEANGSKWAAAVINASTGEPHGIDMWEAALCLLPRPCVTLHDLLAGEHTLESAEYKGSGAKRRGHLSVKLPDQRRLVITVDPSANYMVEKVESYWKEASGKNRFDYKTVNEVVEFAEVASGIFFPKKVTQGGTVNGNAGPSSIITFDDVKVNQPIPAGLFTLRFPRNVAVTDRIAGTTYYADEQGRPISPVKKLGVWVNPSPSAPSDVIPPTTSEADPWAWWPYAWVAGAIGVGVAAWWAWRRRNT